MSLGGGLVMRSKLKICGITNLDDALTVAGLGVEWLGFNFYPGSPRYIEPETASTIIKELPEHVHCVGIIVKPYYKEVEKIINISAVHRVQVYGPQDFNDFSKLSLPSIICYRFKETRNEKMDFMNADMVLIDSFSKSALGGTGKVFDWDEIPLDMPREKLVLAGGINPDNIQQALGKVKPAVIDVASGAEISPGKKDSEKVELLVRSVKEFNENYGLNNI